MPQAVPRHLLCCLLLALAAAGAPPSQQDVDRTERARAAALAAQQAAQIQSEQAAAAEQRLAAQQVTVAAALQSTEQSLADAAQQTEALAHQRDAAAARLQADAQALAPLLPLMQRLSQYPTETLLAAPGSPQDKVRGLLIVQGLVQQIQARAQAVAAEQANLARAQAAVDASLPTLSAAEASQRQQAAMLDELLARTRQTRSTAEAQVEEAARRAAAEAARAGSLRAAIAALAAAPRPPPPPTQSAAPRPEAAPAALPATATPGPTGGWPPPVAGRLVRAFGAPGDAGPASGITLQAAPGGRVVSSCAGRVDFAAPFRSYGRLVIVDCGGGTNLVLAGLDRLDVQAGQPVQQGQPVGIMPGWDPSHPQGGRPGLYVPSLYVEVRKAGAAVNPAHYLRTTP